MKPSFDHKIYLIGSSENNCGRVVVSAAFEHGMLYKQLRYSLSLIHMVRFYLRFCNCDIARAAKEKKKQTGEVAALNFAAVNLQAKSRHVNRA